MLKIDSDIQSVQKVDSSEHNVVRVNSIKKLHPVWRQESKAPTFRPYVSGDVCHLDGKLWIHQRIGNFN